MRDNMTDEYFIRALSVIIVFAFIFGIRWLSAGTKYVNDEYIKPAYKTHKSNLEKYRKYLRDCDKKGKVPLSYNQWKFAYSNKKGKK